MLPFVAKSSGFSEPGIGGRGRRFMKEKIKYTDEPLGDLKVIPDFLPRPEDLVLKDEGVKITISLSKRSIEFFKDEAKKHDTQYQRMIRRLLDAYAERFSQPEISRSRRSLSNRKG
jgi:predicted DNA binding CopG/RHH family protein